MAIISPDRTAGPDKGPLLSDADRPA